MVDVTSKDKTLRVATASGVIKIIRKLFNAIKENSSKKGPVLQTAVIAAIMGAKRQANLFLCATCF